MDKHVIKMLLIFIVSIIEIGHFHQEKQYLQNETSRKNWDLW